MILDLTQVHSAQKAGVSRQTMYAIETQKYEPSVVLAPKKAAICNKNVNDVFELEKSGG